MEPEGAEHHLPRPEECVPCARVEEDAEDMWSTHHSGSTHSQSMAHPFRGSETSKAWRPTAGSA